MSTYSAFGFIVKSDIKFPELEQIKGKEDIIIQQKNIFTPIEWLENKGIRTLATPSRITIGISNIINLEISEGDTIYYQPLTEYHEGKARLYILGIAFSAIIHQRGLLPLHASSLVKKGKALLICGNSGAGKSTTAAALLQTGYQLLSDDISLIRLNENKTPEVLPGFPHLKLWPESAELLNLNIDELSEFAPDIVKKGLRLNNNFQQTPVEISAIIYLKSNDDKISANKIKGVDKIKALIDNTFRLRFVNDTGNHQAYFETTSKLASQTKMLAITRPNNQNSLNEITQLITQFFESK